MKLYIFEHIDQLTANYHSQGGAAVVASSKDAAVALLTAPRKRYDWSNDDDTFTPVLTELEIAEAIEFEVESSDPRVFIFPDAGCC
mgnify:CR=1 FL=1